MSRIKATVRFIHAWRHPEEIAREVEQELRFHIEMRTAANLERGMTPGEAQFAARKSFGDFHQIKSECCEISRSSSLDSIPLTMGLHIALAVFAGGVALWAVNVPHHGFIGVFRELVAIAILTFLFVFVRRTGLRQRRVASTAATSTGQSGTRRKAEFLVGDTREGSRIVAHDQQGRTPVERMFESE